ncbi:hypothetical protein [Flavobacterium sp. JP2137]|uniref:hypothetical protein n=1 Tax=Flavobacterium sp. JP2137 TaxID=3414510 RepID=UPI003D30115A
MKSKSTWLTFNGKTLRVFILFVFLSGSVSYGQVPVPIPEYATVLPSIGSTPLTIASVVNRENAAIGTTEKFATMTSVLLLGVGEVLTVSGESYLQFKFPSAKAAKTTTYVRINLPVQTGVTLDLGVLLGVTTSAVSAAAYKGASGMSNGTLEESNVETNLVVDKNGAYYIAITPTKAYNSVRITLKFPSALLSLGGTITLEVYHAFTYRNTSNGLAVFSDVGKSTGVNLLALSDMVKKPQDALNTDDLKFSTISLGTLAVAGSAFQTFYFNGKSLPGDYVKVKFGIGGAGALDVNLIGSFEIKLYDGAELVFRKKLDGGLVNGLDLLGLLNTGGIISMPIIGPGVPFDRVAIGVNGTVSLNLASNPLKVYSVERFGTLYPDPNPFVPPVTPPMLVNKDCASVFVSSSYASMGTHVVDGNHDTFATLEASSGIVAGAGAYSGHVEMGFATPVPARTTTYVRIGFDEDKLLRLLDGSLGALVGSVVDNVLLGSHYFTIEAKSAGTTVFSRSSNVAFNKQLADAGNGSVKIVQDKSGNFYAAITADVAFTTIRITEKLGALIGLGTTKNMTVYHACFALAPPPCQQAVDTYSKSAGISLDLLGVGGAGVRAAQNAIDLNPATKSEINLGLAGVGASVFQYVDFLGLSAKEDHFRVSIALNSGSLADVGVLSNIQIKAFNGDVEVFSQALNSDVLGLDLLGLLRTGQTVSLAFGPGKPFDRIAIGKSALVAVNLLSSPLYVYGIERYSGLCPDPNPLPVPTATVSPFTTPVCATNILDFGGANFPYNAVDGNHDTAAILTSGTGVVLGAGGYTSHIELGYAAAVPAQTTSYIRVDMEATVLQNLLGGSLGNLLGNVAGGVALGNHYFDVEVKRSGGSSIYTVSSALGFGTPLVKIVQDKDGRYYIAVTANEAYQSVRITQHLAAIVGLNKTAEMKVYNMCRETVTDTCEQASFTSYDGTGLNLSLAGISKAGVSDPYFVIDGNSGNYSTINLGIAGVGASVYQTIYFKSPSLQTDLLRIKVQLSTPNLVTLDLLGAYRVKLYNGSTLVYNRTLQSGLINNIDLLSLLNSGASQELTLKPNVVFDRVQFGIESPVVITTGAPLHLHSVQRLSTFCQDPGVEVPPYVSPVCASTVISASNADLAANIVDGNHNSYAVIRSKGGVLGNAGAYEGHVEIGFPGGANVVAGTTSYIRIDTDATLLQALLAGSVGGVVGEILGNVILGDHFFKVELRGADGNIKLTGRSANSFADVLDQIRIVQDNKGRYYIAIKAKMDYKSVRITNTTNSLLLGQQNDLHIYGMCYETDFNGCSVPFTTSVDGSGVSLGLINIGNYGVTNADRALPNNNNSDYSELSLGTVSVAAAIQQNIHFNKEIVANSIFKLKMALGTGVLTADLLDNVELVGYSKEIQVWVKELPTAVLGNVNLLNVLNNGQIADLTFATPTKVDAVAVRLKSLASLNIKPNLRLYHLYQDCSARLSKGCIISNRTLTQKIKKY